MSIANCNRCHQVFNKLYDRKVCPDCLQADEEAYVRVVAFLGDHPGSPLPLIAAGAACDEKAILRFIREGRITLLDKLGDDAAVDCKRCGVRIASGHYCPKCVLDVGTQLREKVSDGSGQDEKGSNRTRSAETLEEKRGGDSSRRPERR